MTSICIFIILIGISKKNKRDIITKAVISFLLFMINLRIMIPTSDGKMSSNNLDVLFVIDNTINFVGVREKVNFVVNRKRNNVAVITANLRAVVRRRLPV